MTLPIKINKLATPFDSFSLVLFVCITASTFSTSSYARSDYSLTSDEIIIHGHRFNGVVVPSISIDNLPYRDLSSELTPSIVVMGQIGNVFIEGNRFGYLMKRTSFGGFSAVAQIRSHQYLPEDNDLGIAAKDKAFELGAQFAKPLGRGWLGQVTAFTDVSGTHKGQELELSVYRRDFFGDFRLLTLFAMQQQTKKLTGYYADTESYTADADLNFEFEMIGVYALTERLNALVVYRHYLHGQGINNSPLTDNDQTQRLIVGIGWSF